MGIFPIIDTIIDIGRRLSQIINDLKELSANLSISKMTGELSKTYRYRKKMTYRTPLDALDRFSSSNSGQFSSSNSGQT